MLTAKQVAEMFQVSERLVWYWVRRGELPEPIRIGRVVRWRRVWIEDMIERNHRGPCVQETQERTPER